MPVVFTSRFTPVAPSIAGPPPPTGLAASPKTQTQINLSWNPVTTDPGGPGIKDYGIYRIGQGLLSYQTATLYTDSGLTQGTTYTYYVTSRDLNLLESAQSAPASATTYVGPPVPTGLVAQVISNTVIQIQWNASSDPGGPGIARYGVYFNGAKIGEVGSTSYMFTGLNPGTTYGFQVSSIDLNSIESAPCATVFGTTTGGAALTIYHGQTITLTGSGFGAKSQTLFVHDYGQGATHVLDPQWSGGWPNACNASQDNLQNQPLSFAPTGAALGNPDPFALQMMAGCHGAPGNNAAGGNNVNPWVTFTPPAFPYAIYSRHWTRADPNWTFKLANGEYNYKMYNFSVGSAPYGSVYWYWNFDPPAIGNNTVVSLGVSNDVGGGLQNPDANGNSNYWPGNSSLPNHNFPLTLSPFNVNNGTGGWINQEYEAKITNQTGSAASGGGYINWWNQFNRTVAYEGSTDTMSDPHRTFALEGYSVQYPLETNFRYLVNCTVDISGPGATHVARVYWTASATDADGANREVGITQPAGWTNTAITTSFWQGAFATGSAVYPVILQENGTKTIGSTPYTIVPIPPPFDFFIGPSGSDSNAGTLASPWAITAINSKRATYAGKKVGIMDGTYSIRALIQALSGDGYVCALSLNGAGGTSTNPTVIQAVNRGAAIIDCGVPTVNNPGLGTSDGSTGWITIDGIKLINAGSKGIHLGLFSGSNLNIPGWVVQNCEFTGQNTAGFAAGNNFSCIEIQGGLNAVIKNNYFHGNIGNVGPTNGNHYTSTIQWYCIGTQYLNNTCLGPGLYGKESGNAGTTIAYNYIDGTGWTGVDSIQDFQGDQTASFGVNTTFHHNVLIAPQWDCRPTLSAGPYFTDPISVYNNTIVILASGQSLGFTAAINTGLLSHYNNIIYSQATGDLDLVCVNVDAPGLMDYDLFYSSTSAYTYGYLTSKTTSTRSGTSNFTTWKATMTGATCEAHALNATNPLLVSVGSTGASNYKLQGTSPAINAGKSNGLVGGTACDMGAWGNNPPTSIGSSLGPQ